MKRLLSVLFVVAMTTAMAGCNCCGWKRCKQPCTTPGCTSCTPAPSLYDPGLAPPAMNYSTPAEPQATYSFPQ